MGADRHITLKRKMTSMELEKLLEDIGVGNTSLPSGLRWNESLWNEEWYGWKGENDIELVKGSEIHLHYAYWGRGHEQRAEDEADRIINTLKEKGLIAGTGKWNY